MCRDLLREYAGSDTGGRYEQDNNCFGNCGFNVGSTAAASRNYGEYFCGTGSIGTANLPASGYANASAG